MMKWIPTITLALALAGCSDPSQQVASQTQAGANGGLHLVLNIMAGGYDLKIKVNGVDLGTLKPVRPGFSTVALQLYGADNEFKKEAKAEDVNLFCLREGENEIEASFDLVEPEKVSPLGPRVSLVAPSIGPAKPVLDFQQGENQSGRFQALFDCYETMPEDFKTVVPTVE